MRSYNITEHRKQFYQETIKKTGGRCEICGNKDRLFIDHIHGTSQIRGLLCSMCNTGLGMFRDNRESLAKAIDYLKEHPPLQTKDGRCVGPHRKFVGEDHKYLVRLLNDSSFKTDSERARAAYKVLGGSLGAMRVKMFRLRRRLEGSSSSVPEDPNIL